MHDDKLVKETCVLTLIEHEKVPDSINKIKHSHDSESLPNVCITLVYNKYTKCNNSYTS